MRNLILLFALFFMATSHAATTKVPAKQITGLPVFCGESNFFGATTCVWTRTATAIGAFPTTAACGGPTVAYSHSFCGTWGTTDTDLPKQTVSSMPAGTYRATFYVNSYTSGVSSNALAIFDGTTTCEAVMGEPSSTANSQTTVSCIFTYATSGTRNFELYGASSAGSIKIDNSVASAPRASLKFHLEYWGNY